jgi:alpha,alpha-trehalase
MTYPGASSFRPLVRSGGYLPIEDHGLIGDGSTSALVARDGAVAWMCVPRFDSPPLFASLLDTTRGGAFAIAPEGVTESRQYYETDTGVLVTELRASGGLVRIVDALTLRAGADLSEGSAAGRGELLRLVTAEDAPARLRISVVPRAVSEIRRHGEGWSIRRADDVAPEIQLHASRLLENPRESTVHLAPGERLCLMLQWNGGSSRDQPAAPEERLDATRAAWRRWMAHVEYDGPQEPLVRRSALTLKLLDHFANGAIVAAPTSSLPEAIGGVRNWDYRYAWIRDAAFSVYALRRIGLHTEAWRFLAWVLDAIEQDGRPRVLYTLDGRQPAAEQIDPELEGYRRSHPVRWGNAASDQRQHDVFGEILDCAFQWGARGGALEPELWARLRRLVDAARREWRQPDHGIWEVRSPGRVFTYSAAMCQVALDRAARLAQRFGLPGEAGQWAAEARHIREAILEESWDQKRNSLTEHLGGGALDASLLCLPLRRVIPATHPRMIATREAVVRRLGAGHGLLFRYLPAESPDGLPGEEGAFLLCSFWLVDNLAHSHWLDEAEQLYESLCARANPLGLLPEQIDPTTGAFLGNYPQAFSHVGVISSGFHLGRLRKKLGIQRS